MQLLLQISVDKTSCIYNNDEILKKIWCEKKAEEIIFQLQKYVNENIKVFCESCSQCSCSLTGTTCTTCSTSITEIQVLDVIQVLFLF